MISKKKIEHQLTSIKQKGKKEISRSNFLRGFLYFELFARISYKYNLSYTDDDIEKLISVASENILGSKIVNQKKSKVVLYDSFSIDSRGLTQQYLRALISWGFDILYITNAQIGCEILRELNDSPKVEILKFDQRKIESVREVFQAILMFQPEKVLLHFSPWDISGFCIWNSVKGVDKFFINLTDHAFWLGKNCADYILEFRGYGARLTIEERLIPIEKLLFQPYYPIVQEDDFSGFPFSKNGVLAFSGSHLYKISGKDNAFLNLIKDVLIQNEKLLFVLAGPGNQEPIKNFIRTNNLEERFFLIGDRKDISAVVGSIDIYVNTFPMIGGLMSQYAAIHGKPIIGYTTSELYSFNDVEDLLQVRRSKTLVKTSVESFLIGFKELVEDKDRRVENISLTKGCVVGQNEFSQRLFENLFYQKYKISEDFYEGVRVYPKVITNLYIDMENSYLKNHYDSFSVVFRYKLIFFYPFVGLKILTRRIINKLRKK